MPPIKKQRRPLLTQQQVAELLNLPATSLQVARVGRGELAGLPYIKLGSRVRYDPDDVEEFIERSWRCVALPAAE